MQVTSGASRVVLVAAAVCLVTTAACSGGSGRPAEVWGAPASQRLRAEAAALSSGDAYEPLRYWDAGVALDLWGIGPGQAEQIPRAEGVAEALSVVAFFRFEIEVEQVFLADVGAFTIERWHEPPDDTIGVLRRIGEGGDELVRGFLRLVGRGDAFDYRREDLAERLRPLVDAYRRAWQAGDSGGLGALYAPDAIVDTGDGARPWREAVASAGTVTLASPSGLVPEATLYAYSPVDEAFSEAVVLFDLETGAGCPVRVAHLWQLDGARITSDTRFAEVGSAERCLTARARPEGWWQGVAAPQLPEERRNATLSMPSGREVPLYNASPAMQRLLEWGLGRFEAAGLEPPVPAKVVFPPSRACKDAAGGAIETADGYEVAICYTESTASADAACDEFTPGARLFALHELAHVWSVEHLGPDDQERFSAAAGLPGWLAPDIPYQQRGAEHAAETLAWGLDGGTHDRYRNLPSPGCQVVAEHFRQLTGVAPLTTCPT